MLTLLLKVVPGLILLAFFGAIAWAVHPLLSAALLAVPLVGIAVGVLRQVATPLR